MNENKSRSPERVLRSVHPHVLGLYSLYLIWLYLAGVGAAFMYYRPQLVPLATRWAATHLTGVTGMRVLSDLFPAGAPGANQVYVSLWVAALIVPALAIAVGRISFRWILILGGAAGAGVWLKEFSGLGDPSNQYYLDNIENIWLIGAGLLGVLATEIYRRGHSYVITDRRILIQVTGPGGLERSVFYTRIDDLVLSRPLLGSLFGFGTIIPITASGLGMGSDEAGGGLMVGGRVAGANVGGIVTGSHSRNVPRASLAHTLFNVPDPDELYAMINDEIAAHQG